MLARTTPSIQVESDSIFVQDGDVFASAGVTAGIDLALALVERDLAPDLARTVAQGLVVFMQRPGGQSQFSPLFASALLQGLKGLPVTHGKARHLPRVIHVASISMSTAAGGDALPCRDPRIRTCR
jgi:transcriptional regulator GlxA family with amidase domain